MPELTGLGVSPGAAAAAPLLAPVLAGMGVTRLSMSPRALPAVRAALLRFTSAECAELAGRVLAADDPAEAREIARTRHIDVLPCLKAGDSNPSLR